MSAPKVKLTETQVATGSGTRGWQVELAGFELGRVVQESPRRFMCWSYAEGAPCVIMSGKGWRNAHYAGTWSARSSAILAVVRAVVARGAA